MAQYCQIGDTPTVYYKFGGQSKYLNVTFHLAPIDVKVTDSSDSDDDDGSKDGEEVREPCPTVGTLCSLTYSAVFRFGDSYEYEPGQYNEFYPGGGWIFRETYLSFMYEGDESWEFRYEDFAFLWRIEATCFYRYAKSVARPSPPKYYEDLIADGNGLMVGDWAISDSCFPKGGRPETCYEPGQEPPPPPPEDDDDKDKKSTIKVSYNGKTIWQTEGKSPCTYEVACKKDECPPGFLKMKATNPKGFCCIKCQDIQSEVAQIKSLLRQKNG